MKPEPPDLTVRLIPVVIIIIALSLTFCEKRHASVLVPTVPAITSRIFESELGGYGYDILVNDTVFIHQPHIPALNETLGFPSEARAQQVADLVITKIRNGEIPPSVTHEELVRFYLAE